jgi:hypothetical protein
MAVVLAAALERTEQRRRDESQELRRIGKAGVCPNGPRNPLLAVAVGQTSPLYESHNGRFGRPRENGSAGHSGPPRPKWFTPESLLGVNRTRVDDDVPLSDSHGYVQYSMNAVLLVAAL